MTLAGYSAAATQVAAELRIALEKRGMTVTGAARQAHISERALWRVYGGHALPTLANAQKLAELTGHRKILDIVRAARTFPCARPECPNKAIAYGTADKVWCSVACRRLAYRDNGWLSPVGKDPDVRAAIVHRSQDDFQVVLTAHQQAVAKFCRGCEPEGLCRDAGCPLRPVSPLRLIKLRSA